MSILLNGSVVLQKANPPKNNVPFSWSITEGQHLEVDFKLTVVEKISGVYYQTDTVATLQADNVWAMAGYVYNDNKGLPHVEIYANNPQGASGFTTSISENVYVNQELTDSHTYNTTTPIAGTNVVRIYPQGVYTRYTEVAYINGLAGIPVFSDKNAMLSYLNGESNLPEDVNTDGFENNNETPTGGSREIDVIYNHTTLTIDNRINTATSSPYREALYCGSVSDVNGNIVYIPIKCGASWVGSALNYSAVVNGGGYQMRDSAGVSDFFPDVLYAASGNMASAYHTEIPSDKQNNGDFYCAVFPNGTNVNSLMPFEALPTTQWDVVDTTVTYSVPRFDDYDKFIKYLLGEIDEDEAVTDTIVTDSNVETPNDVPVQNMVNGEGVNFYQLTASEIQSFTSWMWNELFKGVDKLDAILNEIMGLTSDLVTNVVGIVFHAITPPRSSDIKSIIIGRFDSFINAYKINNATFTKDCGSVYIPKTGDYTDYLTTVSIYLPYIGICPLSASLVMGKTLKLMYIVDVCSGACTAEIFIDNSLKYSFQGNEGCQIPFSMSNGEEYIANILDFVGKGAAALAGGEAGVAMALSSGLSIQSPQVTNNSGNTSGSISQIMPQEAFVMTETVKTSNVGSGFNKSTGRLLCKTVKLDTLDGFTTIPEARISEVKNDEPPFMVGEYEMLIETLREGVIL